MPGRAGKVQIPGEGRAGRGQETVLRSAGGGLGRPHVHHMGEAQVVNNGPPGFQDLVDDDPGERFRIRQNERPGQGDRRSSPRDAFGVDRGRHAIARAPDIDVKPFPGPVQGRDDGVSRADDGPGAQVLSGFGQIGLGHLDNDGHPLRGVDAGPEMFAGVFHHHPEPDKIFGSRRVFAQVRSDDAIDMRQGVDHPAEGREIFLPDRTGLLAPGNIQGVAGPENARPPGLRREKPPLPIGKPDLGRAEFCFLLHHPPGKEDSFLFFIPPAPRLAEFPKDLRVVDLHPRLFQNPKRSLQDFFSFIRG